MNYPWLQYGDKLPAVAVLQKLLNFEGAKLRADGYFGPRTWQAVFNVQKALGFRPSGQVNHRTWQYLATSAGLQIVDVVDVFDAALSRLEATDIRKVGGTVVESPGSSNALESAVGDVLSVGWDVFLLRFHGHGAAGAASVGTGNGELDPGMTSASDISLGNYSKIQSALWKLRPVFGDFGCVQLMHCQTGRGKSGIALLEKMADDLGVPVTAGINDQLGGGLDTFRFEGPTRTAIPYRLSLAAWANELPDF